ncbi:MAG: type II secretion system protein GspN [Deltaproteobacteria bacterium]|nr:type II secretion system protein GspN [Deltaproteobacteria bacterium]
MSKHRKWVGYTIYCIFLTAGFLYLFFPSDAVRHYLQVKARNLDPPLMVSVDRIKPWPVCSLKFEHTEISFLDKPDRKLFRANRLLLSPAARSFIRGDHRWCFRCVAYGGRIKGCTNFNNNDRASPFKAEIEFDTIRIGTYEHLKELIGRYVDGTLTGTISYSGQRKRLLSGAGEANLKIVSGRIQLLSPVLTLESIEYNEIAINMALKRGTINLTRLQLEGPLLKATLSGSIRLREKLVKSSLDLKGTIEPFAAFFEKAEGSQSTLKYFRKMLRKGAFPFRIHGTLAQPKISFI